jgi:hypothetical protein
VSPTSRPTQSCSRKGVVAKAVSNGFVAHGCGRCAVCDCHIARCVCCTVDEASCVEDVSRRYLSDQDWNILHVRKLRTRGDFACLSDGVSSSR